MTDADRALAYGDSDFVNDKNPDRRGFDGGSEDDNLKGYEDLKREYPSLDFSELTKRQVFLVNELRLECRNHGINFGDYLIHILESVRPWSWDKAMKQGSGEPNTNKEVRLLDSLERLNWPFRIIKARNGDLKIIGSCSEDSEYPYGMTYFEAKKYAEQFGLKLVDAGTYQEYRKQEPGKPFANFNSGGVYGFKRPNVMIDLASIGADGQLVPEDSVYILETEPITDIETYRMGNLNDKCHPVFMLVVPSVAAEDSDSVPLSREQPGRGKEVQIFLDSLPDPFEVEAATQKKIKGLLDTKSANTNENIFLNSILLSLQKEFKEKFPFPKIPWEAYLKFFQFGRGAVVLVDLYNNIRDPLIVGTNDKNELIIMRRDSGVEPSQNSQVSSDGFYFILIPPDPLYIKNANNSDILLVLE